MTKIVTKYTRQQFDIRTCHFSRAIVSWLLNMFAMAKKNNMLFDTCYDLDRKGISSAVRNQRFGGKLVKVRANPLSFKGELLKVVGGNLQ